MQKCNFRRVDLQDNNNNNEDAFHWDKSGKFWLPVSFGKKMFHVTFPPKTRYFDWDARTGMAMKAEWKKMQNSK